MSASLACLAVSAILLIGCVPVGAPLKQAPAPVVAPLGPGLALGPQLAIDVTNASNGELTIGYEFEDAGMSGGGEGGIGPCEHAVLSFGQIGGDYAIQLDGASVLEAVVPAAVPDEAWLVFRMLVDAGGEPQLIGPAIAAKMPEFVSRPLDGCG